MADFGDFLEAKASGSAVLSADDPMAEFLAREQAVLGADAALFGNELALGTATVVSQVSPISQDFGALGGAPAMSATTQSIGTPMANSATLPMISNVPGGSDAWGTQNFSGGSPSVPNAFAHTYSGSPTVPNAFSPSTVPLGFNNTGISTSSFPAAVPEVEPEVIKEWREAYNAAIADRDAKSAAKHEKILEEAKGALERFYADYNDKKAKMIAKNRETGAGTQYEEPTSGTVWDRAVKQIETVSAPTGGNPAKKGSNNPARSGSTNSAADEKGKKASKGRDTYRMKELLQSLKADENAPGLAA